MCIVTSYISKVQRSEKCIISFFQWEKDSTNIRQKSAKVMEVLRNIVGVAQSEEGEGPPGPTCTSNIIVAAPIQRCNYYIHSSCSAAWVLQLLCWKYI